MKTKYIVILSGLIVAMSSCDKWLSPTDATALSEEQTYSSVSTINSVAANLYSRLRYEQSFSYDNETYDLCSWDEAINNSAYWANIGNKSAGYRQYYDYGLIRDINKHIVCLETSTGENVSEEHKRYFLAEARYMRAYTYFVLVSRMGGVPLITEVQEYTNAPLTLAKPRNTEEEIYDFILKETDEIAEDLSLAAAGTVSRATKGAALALKCRAALYAGTLAYNYDKSVSKGLVLKGMETGIPKESANGYLEKCVDAYIALAEMGTYSLHPDYGEVFQAVSNPEVIFEVAYDGTNLTNYFTYWTVPHSMRPETKSGACVNPIANLLDCYEIVDTHTAEAFNPYNGAIRQETLTGVTGSTASYKVFDKPEDFFAGRDPRLAATVMYPGSSFRGQELDFRAGLAIPKGSGYDFKMAPTIEDVDNATALNTYEGQLITGAEGPMITSNYVSHSGLLIRKYVDVTSGSEKSGLSSVPYIVFRYGEVLLNAAEAAFYLNENGETMYSGLNMRELSLDLVNRIRVRAVGESFKISDSELSLDRIKNERRVELAFEDHRYNDLKRWRTADEVWEYNTANESALTYGLWPYKIYAPGEENDGKWIYRRVLLEHRGNKDIANDPINFDNTMYYATYPKDDGNPYIVLNPNH
ncbi:MAG: RagB/SusD family nutrient uptake outer membrane protein [Paludibacteraceae bacterium]|nr:RagB/SusD family nutrient uptake outer membrane protein [Paludibacteraceae bacterium]